MLPVFENCLSSAPDTASFDAVRQSIVILMGSLAKHLDKDNPKIKPIVAQLIGALSTPSQEVGACYAFLRPEPLSSRFVWGLDIDLLVQQSFFYICNGVNHFQFLLI